MRATARFILTLIAIALACALLIASYPEASHLARLADSAWASNRASSARTVAAAQAKSSGFGFEFMGTDCRFF